MFENVLPDLRHQMAPERTVPKLGARLFLYWWPDWSYTGGRYSCWSIWVTIDLGKKHLNEAVDFLLHPSSSRHNQVFKCDKELAFSCLSDHEDDLGPASKQ
ncbi:unnamed protein product [Gadus morhua 'NCC']